MLDKAVDSALLDSGLTQVADAIRTMGGTKELLEFPDDFVSAVEALPILKLESRSITEYASYSTFNDFKNALFPDATFDSSITLIQFVNNTSNSRAGIIWMQGIDKPSNTKISYGRRVGGSFGETYGCDVYQGATVNLYTSEF